MGISTFSNDAYGSAVADTVSCARDAEQLAGAAGRAGFWTRTFTGTVNVADVKASVLHAASVLSAGDYFLLTFSSHGYPPYGNSPRGWAFSDAKFDRDTLGPSDSIERWLRAFAAGVRILIVANCCFAAAQLPADRALVLPWRVIKYLAFRDQRNADLNPATFDLRTFTDSPATPMYESHIYELSASAADAEAFDGISASEMSPFTREVYALVTGGAYSSFDDFMTKLVANAAAAKIPEPVLTPYDAVSAAFAATGPYRVPS
ncbi:MAG TPA: hypothetical protein VFO89_15530 [Thermoanaerobaculia bacterium]|nr:hypothetical protein [Thermoanaerobaculia bacterium]